jgi:CRISPR-associated protein Cas2
MLVIVAYDVNTQTAAGRRRLRRVARTCLEFGQRAQKSVFECVVGERELTRLRAKLVQEINPREDNLRLYFINEADRGRIEAYGQGRLWDFDGPLIL